MYFFVDQLTKQKKKKIYYQFIVGNYYKIELIIQSYLKRV